MKKPNEMQRIIWSEVLKKILEKENQYIICFKCGHMFEDYREKKFDSKKFLRLAKQVKKIFEEEKKGLGG